MREIEVKARVRNKQSLLGMASKQGIKFGPMVVQDDTTYETAIAYEDPAWNIFRIRKQDGICILTMKYKASNRPRDNHERETIIADAQQVVDMLARLGYTEGIKIRKGRRTAHYNGLELCLDEIDELGTFIEVEKLADDTSDVDVIQKELWEVLHRLGIDTEDRVHKGYDTLMYESRS